MARHTFTRRLSPRDRRARTSRVAGGLFVLGVAVAGLLLPAGPVGAAPAPPPTVTFTGGCGTAGAGPSAEPDTDSLTVPAESLVIFVNHLGLTATLYVDDRPAVTLHANEEVPVVFHHGPVTVKLAPACLAAADADPVDVVVDEPITSAGTDAGTGQAGPSQAAQPAARPSSVAQVVPPHRRASRILVLVAVICVVGVSVATIRAIIAQRAIRTASA